MRHWSSFDSSVTDREFAALNVDDRVSLFEAMKLYRMDAGVGYVVKSYGQGILMIKPKAGQGRCLFFGVVETQGSLELVALLAYKKESQKVPRRLLDLASERMRQYKERRK